ncbi:MAG: formylmethanofuran dehydrogenase subunit B [Methylothermaceae bacteria B42]|nr:MAG: formylmethanofuran dehydrogenase subunit B [Methylothermaceae bacteria B42]HHJ38285.1 formylmethanofuran dehydrogenase subunit B [Methylothermaceae bacterium]
MSEAKTIENAVCTFCGCVCDDIELEVAPDGKSIKRAGNACELGRAWFLEHKIEDYPMALVDGQEATVEEAVDAAARILVEAKFPAIYGLSDTTCEAQKEAVAIADYVNGNIDTTTSVCHGPSGMAFQGTGESTASLGEIKNRADFIMYWGGNPVEAHPRHFERYSAKAKGIYLPNGRADRTIVMVDIRKTRSASEADIFLQVKPGTDFEVLWALRALVRGKYVDETIEERTGIPLETLQDLVERMKNCNFGVIFFGMGLSMTRGRHFNVAALLALATDLNAYTHFVANPVRGHGNVTGADNVVSWQTGYPFGVNFNRGYPRFNPGEFTTVDVLARGDADALIVIASDPAANFPRKAIEHLKSIPVITLDPKPTRTSQEAKVAFTVATYGVNVPGTVYRMDNVPLPLRPAFESPYPTDEEILRAIKEKICELKGIQRKNVA